MYFRKGRALGVGHAFGIYIVRRALHAAGGVAIAAHPDRRAAEAIDTTFAEVDGVESAPPMRHAGAQARLEVDAAVKLAIAVHPGIAQIGSSDFHYLAPLGLCRTYVFASHATPAAVVDAVRAGRTVACDASGSTYGAADLAAAVAAECRAASVRRVDLGNNLNRVGVACAWLAYSSVTYAASQNAVHVSLIVMALGVVALLITRATRAPSGPAVAD